MIATVEADTLCELLVACYYCSTQRCSIWVGQFDHSRYALSYRLSAALRSTSDLI
jgi:hypothetical protein